MGEMRTLDLVARDRRSGTVVLMSSVGRPSRNSIRLTGTMSLQPDPGYAQPIQLPIEAALSEQNEALRVERAESKRSAHWLKQPSCLKIGETSTTPKDPTAASAG